MPKLALLDGHSLAYRAFYALPSDLQTPAGQVTNAVFGFTSMLIKLLGEEHPDALAVAWDTPEQTFRTERYPEYKANRQTAPDLFRSQVPLIKEVADALHIRQFEIPGVEADDVIATIAERAAGEGWEVLVVTGDRDAFQLIDQSVKVLYTRRGISDTIVADASYVEDRYGIRPERYPDYAALRGDTSDNLPGVPGVGEKTATRLLQDHGSLEGIFEALDEQTPKLRENLGAARDQVFLNRELTVLRRDVDVEADPAELRTEPWDPAEVRKLFDALAFRTLWDRLNDVGGGADAPAGEVIDVEVGTETDPTRVAALGASPMTLEAVWDAGELAGVMVAEGDETARFVPADALGHLAAALADPAVPKAGHDAKPLLRALLDAGLDVRGLAFDSALAAYVVNPAERAPDLSVLAARILGLEVEPPPEDNDEGAQATLDFSGAGPDLDAAGRRVLAVARLQGPLTEQIAARGGAALYEDVELPLVRVLAKMEHAGIGIDAEYLAGLGDDLRVRLEQCERDIHEAAGGPFNVNSTLQLREVLYDRLELPVLKKTPKGAPSTDASVLAKLVDAHPVVAHLLEYREMEKLRSTYVDGFLPLIGPDGRIHARFNQTAAATGRLSSEAPNLQNIPVRSEEGRTIRRAFVPRPGWRFVAADYSQIELRILAHMSEDGGLLDAFAGDADVHRATAARVFGVAPAEVSPEMRRRAKVINFGLLYGMEAYGLAQRLEITREEAREHMDAYFARFPSVKAFMEGIVASARSSGYTTTLLGRRRYLPELMSTNFRDRQMGERMALNAPIQGSAADVIKKAMVELDERLEAAGAATAMLVQVHDELVFEAPDDEVDDALEVIRQVMEGVVELKVPLRVDVATGTDWANCKA